MSIGCRSTGELHYHETVEEVKNCYGQAGSRQRYRRRYPREAARKRRDDAEKAEQLILKIYGEEDEHDTKGQ